MSLYGKYRPQNFANLVGQEHIRLTLLHEIQQGTLTHAYLFAGPRGTGKTSTARLIAKALNCEKKNPEGEPCDACDFCITIRDGALIDVIEIDAASNRGIDEIRDLKEKIKFAPTRAKTKIYIIDEIHMLTKDAFNALLKTLEEPPENVYFILCTTEIHKIPETIISRCQRFDFKRIDIKTIMTRLNYIAQMEGIEAEDAAIELIARHVEGGMRDAIGLLEQMTINNKLLAAHVRDHMGITGHETIETLLELLEKKELAKAIHVINEVHNEGYDLSSFLREILECLREKLISGIQQGKNDTSALLDMIAHFENARDMLRSTVIPQLPFEIAAIKICGGLQSPAADTATAISEQHAPAKNAKQTAAAPAPAVPETTKEAQAEEIKTAEKLKKDYDTEQFQGDVAKHWPRVLEHVKPPSLRNSVASAKVSETAEGNIRLVFSSRFHMEKANLVENRSKIEKILQQILGKTAKIICEFDASLGAAQKSDIKEEQGRPRERKTAPEKELTPENVLEKATEIFGEE